MKKRLLFLLYNCFFAAYNLSAQEIDKRGIHWSYFGDVITDTNRISRPYTLSDDMGIMENSHIIYPSKNSASAVIWDNGVYKMHSPNGRFFISIDDITYHGMLTKKSDVFHIWAAWSGVYSEDPGDSWPYAEKQKVAEKWQWNIKQEPRARVERIPVAILDDGELVMTQPEKADFDFNKKTHTASRVQFGILTGVYVFDPLTGNTRTIDAAARFDVFPFKGAIQLNAGGKKIIIEERQNDQTIITTYDLFTNGKWKITLPAGSELRQVGDDIALIYQAGSSERLRVVNLKDGSELLSSPVLPVSSFAAEPGFHNITLHGDELHFINLANKAVACLKIQEGKMIVTDIVDIDTVRTIVPGASYYLAVTKDYYGMLPYTIPATYSRIKPYPLFAYFFKRSSGEPSFAITPYYKQNWTDAEWAESKARQESETSAKPGSIFCTRCKGSGVIMTGSIIADDNWKPAAIGFDIYVRNPNGVKLVQSKQTCPVCHGTGRVPL